MSPQHDSSLTWTVGEESSRSSASVIAPAVVVPIVVLGLAALLLFAFMRRRRRNSSAASVSGSDLGAPLAAEGDLQRSSVASAAASDVQIRLQNSPAPRS